MPTTRVSGMWSGLRFVLALLGELLLTGGAVVGLFAAWLSFGQSPQPTAEQRQTVRAIQHAFRAGTAVPPGVVALIRIPALGAGWQYPVYEGTGTTALSRGLAHYTGTAGPGGRGNFAVAGHRSSGSGFEPLADLPDSVRVGDPIVVETAAAQYVYRITGTEQTGPSDVAVLRPDQGRHADPAPGLVTVTTCTPRYGSSGRFVVFGTLVSTTKAPVGQGVASRA
ncbi:sortase [Streptacidiphilus fuscans]|uniref:Class E sortase n=1 Tax=Streptacidiphilus fuscans TaxID=2789292 RepID=A0A931B0I8_9ACTN|nr:sortase [Streptacidiphilus fuscans]MBF9068096.1 class E sortase [Streptacidiphilus fuscans]